MITVTIDGQKVSFEEQITILKAAKSLGIEIPSLCYNEIIQPYSACRICVVEVALNGRTKIAASCSTMLEEGMDIKTDSLRVMNVRKIVAELLLGRAPDSPQVREIALATGVKESRFKSDTPQKCIMCGLCVRACEEIVGVSAISFINRGPEREVATPFKEISSDCIQCGTCAYVCPTDSITIEDVLNRKVIHTEMTLGPTTAIRVPSLQSVPNVPFIDTEACIHFKTGNCGICQHYCERDAINYEMKEEIVEIDVGAVVLSTGYDLFDCSKLPQFGYGRYPNVVDSIQFEKLCHASGPTGGNILLENGETPKSIAVVHCVGSRDEKFKKYCSRVCCMYAMKFAHLVHEKTNAQIFEFYIDMRSFGKGFEEFYHRMLGEGINFIRGKVAEVTDGAVTQKEEGKLIVRCEDTLIGRIRRIPVDMVVLCPAMIPRKDAEEVMKLFGVTPSADGFMREQHPKLAPVSTDSDGIFLAGACQGPKDIPDSVAQGSGAAGAVLSLGEMFAMEPVYSLIDDEKCAGCKICISVCPYDAISYDSEKHISIIEEMLCKGCGSCVSACPGGVAVQKGFKDEQIFSEIEGILTT